MTTPTHDELATIQRWLGEKKRRRCSVDRYPAQWRFDRMTRVWKEFRAAELDLRKTYEMCMDWQAEIKNRAKE